jgi:uncharacterized protein (TIGR02246 family)
MRTWSLVSILATSAGVFAHPSAAGTPPGRSAAEVEVRRAIDAGNEVWKRAFQSLDAAAVAGTFDEEGVNVGLDGTCAKGRAAIQAAMASFFERSGPAVSSRVDVREVVLDGDLAYEWGRSEFHFAPKPGGPRERVGRYLTAWKRQPDGGWKIFRNVGLPEAPRKP